MITAQKNNYSKRHFPAGMSAFPRGGFDSFRRRIATLLANQDESPDLDDDALFGYYLSGESETYVVAALGCEN